MEKQASTYGATRRDDVTEAAVRQLVECNASEASLLQRLAPVSAPRDIDRIVSLCRHIVFPQFFGPSAIGCNNLLYHTGIAVEELRQLLESQIAPVLPPQADAQAVALDFISYLPELRRILLTDAEATYLGDPAAVSVDEVIFCYPGLRATLNYRVAHRLLELGVPLVPRMIGELAHRDTGIDIHPGASIGESFVIDHGTGVVIGATAIIGRNVKLYQGVTLGARSFDRDADNNPVKGVPRHPVVGDDVVIYSNTTVLGRITIGSGAVIGGNLWVTEDVAPGEKLVQARPDNILRFKI